MDEENNIPEEEVDNIIVLNDETGAEVQFEFLDLVELDGCCTITSRRSRK